MEGIGDGTRRGGGTAGMRPTGVTRVVGMEGGCGTEYSSGEIGSRRDGIETAERLAGGWFGEGRVEDGMGSTIWMSSMGGV